MKAKLTLLLVTVVASVAMLAGCGNDNSGGAEQVFRMNLSSEPPTLDPALMQDQVSSTVMSGLFEGLTRSENGETKPAMADKWEVSQDGLKYTFHIREGAKWSNGDPVTAQDFEYSWKRTLDPNLNPPAPYAYQLYYLKGAEEYNTKADGATVDGVGVKAVDDSTLEVELKNPTPYFLNLTSFYTYYPVDKAVVSANAAWAAEAATYVSNGPFKLENWAHNDSIDLVPFADYYDKDSIKLEKVHFVMISDPGTESNMYETDELDWSGLPTGSIPTEQLSKLIEEKNPELLSKGTASTYYYDLNNTKKPFNNVKVRKALAMAINREDLVTKVTKGGQTPAYAFVPPGIHGVEKDFRDEVESYFKEDVTEAKKLLAEGLAEEGMTAMPEFELSFNDGGQHKQIAEAIADMWNKNLGITVKTQVVEWKVFLQNRTSLAYDVARAGWGADYNDPMTYMDMWLTGGGNNDIGFSNAEYDKLVKEANATQDQKTRVDLMAKAEKILIGDNMAIIPLYYYASNALVKPYVKNVLMDYKGDIDYTRAYIEK